jgi:hypothetical protein
VRGLEVREYVSERAVQHLPNAHTLQYTPTVSAVVVGRRGGQFPLIPLYFINYNWVRVYRVYCALLWWVSILWLHTSLRAR